MANTKNGSNYPPVHGDSTQDWIGRYQEIDAERGALKAENERLRAALTDALDNAILATEDHDHDESESCFACNVVTITRAALAAKKG